MTIPSRSELARSYCIILNNEGVALIRGGKLNDAREVLQAASSLHQRQLSSGNSLINHANYHVRLLDLSNEIVAMDLWGEDIGFALSIAKVTNESTLDENTLDGHFTSRIDQIIEYNLALAKYLQFLTFLHRWLIPTKEAIIKYSFD